MTLTTLAARVGRQTYPVTSFAQVSAAYRQMLDALDLGASTAPKCEIVDSNGAVVAYVSFNGKVWAGATYVAGAQPIYDPYR